MLSNTLSANIRQLGFGFARASLNSALIATSCGAATLLAFDMAVVARYQRFSPTQKYWFPIYCRCERSLHTTSVVPLLLVENSDHTWEFANPHNVQPGVTLTPHGRKIPFVLQGEEPIRKRLVLLPPMPQNHGDLWHSLKEQVYDGQSVEQMREQGIDIGFCAWLIQSFPLFLRQVFSDIAAQSIEEALDRAAIGHEICTNTDGYVRCAEHYQDFGRGEGMGE